MICRKREVFKRILDKKNLIWFYRTLNFIYPIFIHLPHKFTFLFDMKDRCLIIYVKILLTNVTLSVCLTGTCVVILKIVFFCMSFSTSDFILSLFTKNLSTKTLKLSKIYEGGRGYFVCVYYFSLMGKGRPCRVLARQV